MSEKNYESPSGPGLDLEDFHPAAGEEIEMGFSPAQARSGKYAIAVGKKHAAQRKSGERGGVVGH